MFAAVSAFVEAAFAAAADDRPGLALEMRHPGIDDVRIPRLQLEVHRADAVRDKQNFAPRLTAVSCFKYAALVIGFESIALCRYPDNVRISRMNANCSNLAGVVQPNEFPSHSAIGRLVNAAAGGNVTAHVIGSGTEINDVRIGISNRNASR